MKHSYLDHSKCATHWHQVHLQCCMTDITLATQSVQTGCHRKQNLSFLLPWPWLLLRSSPHEPVSDRVRVSGHTQHWCSVSTDQVLPHRESLVYEALGVSLGKTDPGTKSILPTRDVCGRDATMRNTILRGPVVGYRGLWFLKDKKFSLES